jgi:hypothetical protein
MQFNDRNVRTRVQKVDGKYRLAAWVLSAAGQWVCSTCFTMHARGTGQDTGTVTAALARAAKAVKAKAKAVLGG